MRRFYSMSMPAQKLSYSEKDMEWRKQCVDAIISMAGTVTSNGRTSKQNKQVNYDLYNSKFDEKDFDYILDPYGAVEKWGESPAKMQNYNIIRSKIELLKGEEIRRPFNFRAVGTAGNVVTSKKQKQNALVLEMLQNMIAREQGQQVDAEGNMVAPEQVQKYISTQLVDHREITANQILEYLLRKEKMEMKFNQGWEHALIVAEEIYYVGIANGEPVCRVVNPLNFDYDKDEDLKFIEDSQWCKEERYMTVGSILDTFGDQLSDDEIKLLDEGQVGGGFSNRGMQHSFVYDPQAFSSQSSPFPPIGSVYVANVCWKSMKRVKFLGYLDPKTNQPQLIMVDETYELTPDMREIGATLEERWINEAWEGTRIGDDIYVNIRPLPNQQRSLENPSECKLPYAGYVYNNTNSQATSLVDLCKPHQYTYIIVWWRLENELAKAKGKKFVMDFAQLPRSEGWTVDQWMYYFDNLGVIMINSMEEGREGDRESISKFNQFTDIDMSLSQVVGQYMEVLAKLEEQVSVLTGVTPQREGQIQASETVGGVERSNLQSSHITEPLFYYHNLVKQQVLTKLLETAKIAYIDGTTKHYIVDEIYTAMLQVDGDIFCDSDYGVFLSNSSKDHQIKEKLEGLAQMALQKDRIALSDIIKIYKSNSIAEIEAQINKSEGEAIERDQQNLQADRDVQMQIQQKQEALERDKLDRADMNAQLDRENKLELEQIKALGFSKNGDVNANGIPDVTEQGKLALEHSRESFVQKESIARLQLDAQKAKDERTQKDKEFELKAKETQLKAADVAIKAQAERNKKEIEDKKLEIERKNQDLEREKMQNDLKLADKEMKMKEQESKNKVKESENKIKESEAKMKLEKYKVANKPKPAKPKKK